jgi:hypothetical protein
MKGCICNGGNITLYVRNKLQLCMYNDNIKVGEITLYVEV